INEKSRGVSVKLPRNFAVFVSVGENFGVFSERLQYFSYKAAQSSCPVARTQAGERVGLVAEMTNGQLKASTPLSTTFFRPRLRELAYARLVAAALMALAVVLVVSQEPAAPDPGFASAAVLP